jgi:hypothetical protein
MSRLALPNFARRLLPLALLLGACTVRTGAPARSSQAQPKPALQTHGGETLSLRYEGSCAHLACCSAYAVQVPANTPGAFSCAGQKGSCSDNQGWFAPAFTCDPQQPGRYRQPADPPFLACDDHELWLSLPGLRHAQCGENYVVCRGGTRVIAVARDRSAGNDTGNVHYEGSLGLLHALGADPGERETVVSIYPLTERERMAMDPACSGSSGILARVP